MIQYMIAAVVLAALLGYGGGVWTGHYFTALVYDAAIAKQKGQAAQALSDAKAETAAVERRLEDTKHLLEVKDAKHQAEIDQAFVDHRRLADRWMREQRRRARCDFAAAGDSGAAGRRDEAAAAELPGSLERFLPEFARDAERVRVDLGICQAYALTLRQELSAYRRRIIDTNGSRP